jgi:hypothetical protein
MENETREVREDRLRTEADQMEGAEREATDNLKKKMTERYKPLVELLQTASVLLNNYLVDVKNAERYADVMAIEYAIRRDGSDALGVGIAMLVGVEMRKVPAKSAAQEKPSGIILPGR